MSALQLSVKLSVERDIITFAIPNTNISIQPHNSPQQRSKACTLDVRVHISVFCERYRYWASKQYAETVCNNKNKVVIYFESGSCFFSCYQIKNETED